MGLVGGLLVSGARAEEKPAALQPIRVALFHDKGVSDGVNALFDLLSKSPELKVDRINAVDVAAGKLTGYDVVLHPGGSGGGQGKALGDEGREKVRDFVRKGGGYVGICAGAYLATCDYPWSLHILDAKVIDRAHWARGTGDVEVSVTPRAKSLLGFNADRKTILYWQGPLLAPANNPDVPDYEKLGTFETEIAKKGAPTGVMIGTTAIAAGKFGSGRVLCFSPHPEKTPGEEGAVVRALLFTAGKTSETTEAAK
jgi:hypothetical protein